MRVTNACGNAAWWRLLRTQGFDLRILYVGIRSLDVSHWFQETHLQIVDAIDNRDGQRAAELWTTDLHYGERLISDALLKLPELSEVNLASAMPGRPYVVPRRI